jgi:diguanylate cyclase (GGDEF)-like protein
MEISQEIRTTSHHRARLCLYGVWLGDAFGSSLFFPQATQLIEHKTLPHGPWRWTEDTPMALSVVEELFDRGWIDQDSLARRLARRYLADPVRGYGPGTAKILERIASGEYFRAAARSIFPDGSYGCSVAPRSAPVGAYHAGNPHRAAREARLVAGVTTIHPEGIAGAEAVAIATSLAAGERIPRGADFLTEVIQYIPECQVRRLITHARDIPAEDMGLAIRELGVGNQHTSQDTVPFALWCAAHHLSDFAEALWWTVSGTGLRDTLCALVGGIVALSSRHLPDEWLMSCERLPGDLAYHFEGGPKDTCPSRLTEPENDLAHVSITLPGEPDFQTDPLTGLPNLLSLLNWAKKGSEKQEFTPFSLIAIHLSALARLNQEQGSTTGDELLKGFARKLRAQRPGQIFRSGSDRFTILVENAYPEEVVARVERLVQSIDLEGIYPGGRSLRCAVIHFSEKASATPGKLLVCHLLALAKGYQMGTTGRPVVCQAESLLSADMNFSGLLLDLVDQYLRLGNRADETLRLAVTDSVSQLPNMRAAMSALETGVDSARKSGRPLALLLIDGDNLRDYNQISYEAGDEAIRLLGDTIQGELRACDFVARWRVGDEFLVLMVDTPGVEAQAIASRLCQAVQVSSRAWLLPTTISIGIALFPDHGRSVQELIHFAEQGLAAAKKNGKNQFT